MRRALLKRSAFILIGIGLLFNLSLFLIQETEQGLSTKPMIKTFSELEERISRLRECILSTSTNLVLVHTLMCFYITSSVSDNTVYHFTL